MEQKFINKEIEGSRNQNIEKLKKIFPNVIKDGKVDFQELKSELGEFKETVDEKYEFNWIGKQKTKREAMSGINGMTLKYFPEESKDSETTQNIYIEGDNLPVLKLLRNNYANKIKMIYIDPPYNTGSDLFIYSDKFQKNSKESQEELSITEDGEKNINILKDNMYKNTKDAYAYHSNWINMMYPRIKIAHELLKEDGVMCVSIDDNEVDNLKKILEEIFGHDNVETVIWKKIDPKYDRNSNAKIVTTTKRIHEYIVVAFKDREETEFGKIKKMPNWLNKYTNPDNDPRGAYKQGIISFQEGHKKEDKNSENYYTITTPSGRKITRNFFFSKEQYLEYEKDNRIYYPSNGDGIPALKIFENEEKDFYFETILEGVGSMNSAKKELAELFEVDEANIPFDTPKPTKLLKELIRGICGEQEETTVLDFFAGSSSTMDAIMQLNAENKNNNIKYIAVQLQDDLSNKENTINSKTKNIAVEYLKKINKPLYITEIGKERIRRAGEKIKKEENAEIDYGFKVFKLDETNINWEKEDYQKNINDYILNTTDIEKEMLLQDFNEGAKDIDIVYELLLRYYGMPLSAKINRIEEIGNRTYSVNDVIIVCLEDEITKEIVDKLSNMNFAKLYLRDSSFKGKDSLEIKENLMIRLNLQKEYNNEKSYRVEFI